jgi:hypothetical protein
LGHAGGYCGLKARALEKLKGRERPSKMRYPGASEKHPVLVMRSGKCVALLIAVGNKRDPQQLVLCQYRRSGYGNQPARASVRFLATGNVG